MTLDPTLHLGILGRDSISENSLIKCSKQALKLLFSCLSFPSSWAGKLGPLCLLWLPLLDFKVVHLGVECQDDTGVEDGVPMTVPLGSFRITSMPSLREHGFRNC